MKYVFEGEKRVGGHLVKTYRLGDEILEILADDPAMEAEILQGHLARTEARAQFQSEERLSINNEAKYGGLIGKPGR